MPHWAEIDENNKVLRVTYGDGTDEETYRWLIDNLGGTWVRTYYSTPGQTYAGIGFIWDPQAEDFTPPTLPLSGQTIPPQESPSVPQADPQPAAEQPVTVPEPTAPANDQPGPDPSTSPESATPTG